MAATVPAQFCPVGRLCCTRGRERITVALECRRKFPCQKFGAPSVFTKARQQPLRFSTHSSVSDGTNIPATGIENLPSEESLISRLSSVLTSLFPLWVIAAAALAVRKPWLFTWNQGNVMVAIIGLTMLGMGSTLSLDDIKRAASMPKELIAGVLLQYSVMPAMGALVTSIMGLDPHYSTGIVLVACCPGGTASNVVTYLARGNVALSVLMTAASTILAVIMTPLLTSFLAGKFVPVNGAALFASTIQVVLLPVLIGALCNHYFPKTVRRVSVIAPLVAVMAVASLVGSAVATNAQALQVEGAGKLLAAVVALHGGGFLGGFLLSKFLGFEIASCRTVSIEVGMQNSVLGVLLATQHFGNPLTAVPCALSSVTHSVMGSMLGALWRMQDHSKDEELRLSSG